MAKEMKALTINGETYEIVDEYARSHSGSGSSAELEDIRLGADGKKFGTAGEAVRQQFRYVGGQIDHIEEEIQNIDSVFKDICYDSDGYKYPTPGDTIRMQFDSVKHSIENIDESIDHVIDLFDIIEEEVYDARIGADGVEYETAGEAVRAQMMTSVTEIVTDDDVTKGEYWYWWSEWTIGSCAYDAWGKPEKITTSSDYFTYTTKVKCGEKISTTAYFDQNSESEKCFVTNDEGYILEILPLTNLNTIGEYTFQNDGILYLSTHVGYFPNNEILIYLKRIKQKYIASPSNAEVGQTLVVKEVDKNGFPVSWKTEKPSSEEVIDIRTGVDGETYETAGEAIRTQFSKLIRTITRTIGFENTEFEYGKVLYGGAYRIGDVLSTVFGDGIYNYYLFRDVCVHKNEMLSIANGWKLKSDYFASVIVTDYSHVIKKIIPFDFFNDGGKYIAEEDVLITLSCEQYSVNTTEIFHVKKTVTYEPFVLNAEDAEIYLTSPTFGDEALNAILYGRQILVRVLNASGDNYVASYSPIYMYQLPNDKNNYLYLFYLKDEKQNIDLSALGLGTIQVPLYGELKLLLSENYYKTPLE